MFFNKKNKEKKEYYFGLFLKGDEATGFVFEITDEHFSVLHHHTAAYTNGWENIIQDIDDILSKLETTTRLHLKKVIFFLYSYFIDDASSEIRQPYKNIIKNISKELDLQPLGYIECNEAVAQYLERRDKSPLNVILVEIDKTNVDICVYKGSRKVTSKTISRTLNLVDDLTTIFMEVKTQTLLPSRLVLYDSSDLDEESVKILEHKWDKEIFIQHPRVEVIKRQDLYTELGAIFSAQLRDPNGSGQSVLDKGESQSLPPETMTQEPTLPPIQNVAPVTELPNTSPLTAVPQENMGFTITSDDDVTQPQYQTAAYQGKTTSNMASSFKKPARPAFKLPLPKMSFKLPKVNILRSTFFIGLLLIIISLFLIETRFHTATLTIILPSKTVSKDLKIDDLNISTSTTSASVDGSASTTGKRDIGEKAHGEVTIHNFDLSEKQFTKGTNLEVDGIAFVLDQDVTVASGSETLEDDKKVNQAGKTKTSITAVVLGPEGNLEKGKRFQIADEPTSRYFAVNESALSGGSKKTVRTVAKKDIDDLKKSLLEKGTKQAVENIKKEQKGGAKILDSLTEAELTSAKATKEVGEESDKVGLTVQVSTTYYYFDEASLKERLASDLKKDVPADFEMDSAALSYTIQKVEKEDDTVVLSIAAKETASKKISESEVANAVKGKSKNSLAAIIKDKTNATGYKLDISSPIPVLNSLLPFLQKNIVIKTTTE